MDEVLEEVHGTKIKEIHYWLFNDLLLRAIPKKIGEGFTCKTQIPLEFLLVNSIEESGKLYLSLIFFLLITLSYFTFSKYVWNCKYERTKIHHQSWSERNKREMDKFYQQNCKSKSWEKLQEISFRESTRKKRITQYFARCS